MTPNMFNPYRYASGCNCTTYNTNASSNTYLDFGSQVWAGVVIGTVLETSNAHLGKKLCSVKFRLYKTGTITQTLSFGIVSTGTTDGTLDYSFTETVDADSLTTDTAGEDIEISGETLDHELAVNDVIAVRVNNTTSGVKIRTDTVSDAMTNAKCARLNNAGTWNTTHPATQYVEGNFGVCE
tara:strand:- start:549 stop:1094 length:546 start_codon:yes stop_codon:yes gene_type:complete